MRKSPNLNRLLTLAAWSTLTILGLIITFVLLKSLPFIKESGIAPLWQDPSWHPTEGKFNILPMVLASLFIMVGAVLLASPLGVMLALFMRYYAPKRMATFYRALIELLAGVPSVVYGFWGLIVLVPFISKWVPPGASVLAACLVLGLMILPLVVLITDSALEQTPEKWIAAADALALKRWSRIWRIILPNAMPSILSGTVLQAGRALGETMAVLMVCGNIVQIPGSLFDPARTLTANIALEMAYATGNHTSALFISGFVLLLLTIVLVLSANKLNGANKLHV